MNSDSTRPVTVRGVGGTQAALWQSDESSWSFGPIEDRVVGQAPRPAPSLPNAANTPGVSTVSPEKIAAPKTPSVVLRRKSFGKRALQALSHWEGVVEELDGNTFRCRLVPLKDGQSDPSTVEFTEFSYEDLANESDRELVQPGAILYWTIGRARNSAGTVTNVSLVRFRRLASPGAFQLRRARLEAQDLLREPGDGDRPDSSGN